MGIPELLQRLGPLVEQQDIFRVAAGKRLGVDGHVWLHQLAYRYAESIVVHGDYRPLACAFLKQAKSIKTRGIDLYFVFDGDVTPAKAHTDLERQEIRMKALEKILREGENPSQQSVRGAVTVGWVAVSAVIAKLREDGIAFVVAPNEADGQLSLMSKQNQVYGCCTVDRDFIVHGIDVIFFDVNWNTGQCKMYERRRVTELYGCASHLPRCEEPFLKLLQLCGPEVLTAYALAAGCDYGTKVAGVGPAKAVLCLQSLLDEHGPAVFENPSDVVEPLSLALKRISPGVLTASFIPWHHTDSFPL
jgi:exonuclease-1